MRQKEPRNTKKAYKTYVGEYLAFTAEQGLDPKSPVSVASFMKCCVSDRARKLARGTVCVAVPAAIRDFFRFEEINPVDSEIVRYIKKTVSRVTEAPKEGRMPLTFDHLRRTVDSMDSKDLESLSGSPDDLCLVA
jgi:hypothetical protein